MTMRISSQRGRLVISSPSEEGDRDTDEEPGDEN